MTTSIFTAISPSGGGGSNPPARPVNTVAGVLSGDGDVGATLTGDGEGTWTTTGALPVDYLFQFYIKEDEDSEPVESGGLVEDCECVVPLAAANKLMIYKAVALNGLGKTYGLESNAILIAADIPYNITPPSISGDNEEGATLTRVLGEWGGDPAPSVAGHWEHNDAAYVPAKTGATMVVPVGDGAKAIKWVDEATNLAGTVSEDSNIITIQGTTEWTNEDGDNLWDNPLNWTNGAPSIIIGAILGTLSNDNCITPDEVPDVLSIDASTFTGELFNAATLQDAVFNVYGNVALNSAIQTPRKIQIQIMDDCELTTGGFAKMSVTGSESGKLLTLMDDVSARAILLQNMVVHYGTKKITFSDAAGSNGTCSIVGGSATWSTGAKIITTTSTTMDMILADAPPIEMKAGAGTVRIDTVTCESFLMEAGELSGTGSRTLTTTGDFTATGGEIDGNTALALTVGGDFSIDGVDMTDVTGDVTGAGVAMDAVITDCDFSASTTDVDATDGCTDGTGNDGFDFGVPVTYTVWSSASVGTDHSLSNGDLTDTIISNMGDWLRSLSAKTSGKYLVQIKHDSSPGANRMFMGVRKLSGHYACLYAGTSDSLIYLTGVSQGNTGITMSDGDYSYHLIDLDAGTYRAYKDQSTPFGPAYALPSWTAGSSWNVVLMSDGATGFVRTANFGTTPLTADGIAIATAETATQGWPS